MTSYVYIISNKLSNLSYIGKTNRPNKRLDEHYRKDNSYIGNALKKYGKENFLFQIIEKCLTEEEAYFLEWWNIKYYRTKTPNGYNLNDGGEGSLKPSEETRKKISNANGGKNHHNYGKHLSEETKKKIREARSRQVFTEETRNKLSEAQKGNKKMLGKKHTEETKRKMSETHRRLGTKPPSWKGKHLSKESIRKRTKTRRKNGWNKR